MQSVSSVKQRLQIVDMLNTKKLQDLMDAGDWNSRSLAAAAELPHTTVWRTVRGTTSPTLETLTKLCVPLNVRPGELLDADERDEEEAA